MSERLLVARLVGGLGNQLFIYAAARRLSLVTGMRLVLDSHSGFERDRIYMRTYQLSRFFLPCRTATAVERFEPFSTIRRPATRVLSRVLPWGEWDFYKQRGFAFDPELLQLKPRRSLYLEGYWQSEDYFRDVKEQIKVDLRIKPPTDALNLEMAEMILSRQAVALHVRFFSSPSSPDIDNNNASVRYYRKAISFIQSKVSSPYFFIFSDRPDLVRSHLAIAPINYTIVSHNLGDDQAFADLWLMTKCSHFITANSTFSWWAAWLGEKSSSIVIAPKEVHGRVAAWGFESNLPDRWLKIDTSVKE